ncbi:Sad1/UNC-like protein, partial [Peniophora sp. CONT]
PNMALHHINAPGYCWPFSGAQGHLGIRLARRIFVDEVTIDHVAEHLVWDRSSAPRQMSLWGLVDTKGKWVSLATMSYDVSAGAVQTFAVDSDIGELGVPFQTVMLVINDNWGAMDFTCVYRVRVHGR